MQLLKICRKFLPKINVDNNTNKELLKIRKRKSLNGALGLAS
jgi:hypothetical protein